MKRGLKRLAVLGCVLVLGLSTVSFASEVYLNNVQITGAKDQVIDKAKVILDKNGDVYIVAPDYKVREVGSGSVTPTAAPKTSPPPAAPTTSAKLKKLYVVVTEVTRPNVTGYSIQIIVNNKFLKTISDAIPQHVVELNNYLVEGANAVSFRALRQDGKSAQSTQASDSFNVVLGEGQAGQGGALSIDEVLGEFSVTAVDRGEKAKTFDFTAR